MPEALEPVEQLIARANNAIAEARQLVEAHRELQRAQTRMHQTYFRATFHPKTLRLHRLRDFPGQRQPYRPFPSQADEP